jgi:hypothetical protein
MWRLRTARREACAFPVEEFVVSATVSGLSPALLSQLDHIIFATPDLDLGIDTLERRLGIRATRGGQHLGHGTRNAFIGLQGDRFLEILGPDPDQAAPKRTRWLAIDSLQEPRLTGWAAKGHDLQSLMDDATRQGVNLGEVLSGKRTNNDGSVLTWCFTDPYTRLADGIIPFFIDWGNTPHPSQLAAPGAQLNDLWAEHPGPVPVQTMLRVLGLDLPVRLGPKAGLVVNITGPHGRIELR